MNLENVSMIIAPNLFLPGNVWNKKQKAGEKVGVPTAAIEKELRDAAETSNVVRLLIRDQDELFTVSRESERETE